MANDNDNKQVEIQLYQTVAMRDGKKANNPWLQELPDPVSKATWENYAAMSPRYALKLELEQGDIISIKVDYDTIELPVLLQPGQAWGTISVAVGYGRTVVGPVGTGSGQNAYPFMTYRNGTFQTTAVAFINKTGESSPLAQTQTHHSYEGRNSIIRETTFTEYKKDPYAASGHGDDHKTLQYVGMSMIAQPITG